MSEKWKRDLDAWITREEPDYNEPDCCPECGGPTEEGFGLAGSGYGAYRFCRACEKVVSKTQEIEEDDEGNSD